MPFGRAAVRLGCFVCLVAGLAFAPDAGAWEAVTGPLDLPVVAVDKAKQRLFLLEGGTVRPFVCTTGQREGDKQVRGDLKTPEGVYFVLRKRTDRLDFEDYGGEAYILDYPWIACAARPDRAFGCTAAAMPSRRAKAGGAWS